MEHGWADQQESNLHMLPHVCGYFENVCMRMQVPGGLRGFEKYRYMGGYWEARESGNWEGVRNIYGPGPNDGSGPEKPAMLIF